MKATLALLFAVVATAKANPGGGGGQGGGWGGQQTQYQTHVVTTAVVSQWYHTQPSICETWTVSREPPIHTTITTTSTWQKPGHPEWYTSYVPCPTTLPGKEITISTTYTTEVTITSSTTIYEPTTITDTLIITSDHTITLATTIPTTQTVPTIIPTTIPVTIPTTIPTTIETTQLVPTILVQYQTVTEKGTTQVIPVTQTSEVTIVQQNTQLIPTTITEENTVTEEGPTSYQVQHSTVSLSGSTIVVENTVTKEGPTQTQTQVQYSTVSLSGSTIVVENTVTKEGPPQIQVQYSTVSLSGSTIVVDNTITKEGPTQVQYSTVVSGSTIVVESTITAQGPTQTLLSTLPGETISGPTISLVDYETISLNGTTQVITLPQSTVVQVQLSTISLEGSTEVITLPQSTIIDVEYSTLPGQTIEETLIYTASAPTVYSYVTITQPAITITEAPPPPASTCNATGFFPGPDGNACGGESCYIDFDLDGAVHWDTRSDLPPLVTVERFENPSLKATCITTFCNTAAFAQSYSTSQASCARPPCPSNSLDCDCNIVVGPIGLPGGGTTSVTQTGTSGWYLNLGPQITAVNVPSCSSGSPQCLTSVPTSRPEPLLYTGDIITPTAGNASNATPTQFLLPDLPGYFPPDSPYGDCTTAVFDPAVATAAPRLRREHLYRRQQQRFANPGSFTWPATNGITQSSTYTALAANAPSAQSSPLGSPQPIPEPSSTSEPQSPPAATPTTVTAPASTVTAAAPTSPNPETTPTTSQALPPSEPAQSPPTSTLQTSPPATEQTSPAESGPTSTSPPPVVPAPSPSGTTNTAGQPTTPTAGSPSTASGQPTGATGSPSPSAGGSIGSSIATPTSVTTGTDGKVTVTETVYYSMISPPGSQSLSNAASASSSGPLTQSSDGGLKNRPRWLVLALTMLIALVALL